MGGGEKTNLSLQGKRGGKKVSAAAFTVIERKGKGGEMGGEFG